MENDRIDALQAERLQQDVLDRKWQELLASEDGRFFSQHLQPDSQDAKQELVQWACQYLTAESSMKALLESFAPAPLMKLLIITGKFKQDGKRAPGFNALVEWLGTEGCQVSELHLHSDFNRDHLIDQREMFAGAKSLRRVTLDFMMFPASNDQRRSFEDGKRLALQPDELTIDGSISPDILPFLTGLLDASEHIQTLRFRALAVRGVDSEALRDLVLGCGITEIELWSPESQFSNSASDSD